MSDFREVTEEFWASPQITVADVAEAAEQGFVTIINNRPEGESSDQTEGAKIREAALATGMAYHAIPITHAGFSEPQVKSMADLLDTAEGKVLAYCRSGTRSTLLWALAQSKTGGDPEELAKAADRAGYNVAPIWEKMQDYAAKAKS
ncbi:TIGR01244 family sulfur transferase [Alteraurantiacibacter aquimixticola]|uniref:TIGR01244 family phosphatase n=1 Tax=Alteraurantiacibacter aquimixticola TaxID=2489173 RepID=A0A4T3EXR2_9SPHN|nr:TIGR01244 family sulfur transferase [Alteraurantiacibacter aquimixticola]TIX49366.1 TIGR01244 family phosphatase [Alteraurantiacibacter aquimixticola]